MFFERVEKIPQFCVYFLPPWIIWPRFLYRDYTAADGGTLGEWDWIWKNSEVSSRDIIEILSRHLYGGTRTTTKILNQENLCSSRDSKGAHSDRPTPWFCVFICALCVSDSKETACYIYMSLCHAVRWTLWPPFLPRERKSGISYYDYDAGVFTLYTEE
jgi:hypothetical protein